MADTQNIGAGPRLRSAPLQLLSERDFRRVWFAGAMSGIMRWLDVLAVSVYVLQETGSAFYVALTLFVRIIPMFFFGAVAGAIAERVDRKKLLIMSILFLACIYGILFWLAYTGAIQVWQLGIVVFFSGMFWTLELPIRRTMIAEIAGIERIGATMGLESSTTNFTRMLGPLLGGFLFELYGLPGTLVLGAGLYLLAAIALLPVEYASLPSSERPSILTNLIEGFQFVRSSRPVMATLAITLVLNLFGFSFVSMIPVIAKQELGLSPFPTGVLMSAEGCGAFVGALLIAFYAQPGRFHQIYLVGSAIYLVCIMAFATSGAFGLSAIFLWLAGFGVAGFASMQSALIIANSPPEIRNRTMGVLTMCIGIGPLGILVVGTLAENFGAATGVLINSGTGLIALIVCAILWPEMRRLRATE
ncbi:MAG: MFS transporter [Rhodospirillales bacterium]|nr:MFS transporter [Rhodospirillales bacterium]